LYCLAALLLKLMLRLIFMTIATIESPLLVEFGASVGAMNCLTDIGGRKGIGKKFIKDLNLGKTQPCASFYVAANFKYAFALRAEVTIGKIQADDKVLEVLRQVHMEGTSAT